MDAKIVKLNSVSSSPLQLTLKVQDNNTSRVRVEEGTLILALASISQASSEDMNLSVSITSAAGVSRVNERFSSFTRAAVIPAGSTSAFINIQTNNDLLYQGDDEEFTLSISAPNGVGLAQSSSSIILLMQDNETLPIVSFLNGAQNKNENSGAGQVSVELSAAAINTVSVKVVALDQTATGGTDFNFTSQLLTFSPGEVSKTVNFSLLNRIGIQPSRNFKLQLIDAINTVVTTNNTGVQAKEHIITILDVDRPSLSINDVIVNEGSVANFTLSSSAPFGSDVTVDYNLVMVNAVASTDVVVSSGTITLPANSTAAPLNISTLSNPAICDGSKTFKVILSNSVNATIGDNEGLGTINDITNPSISFSNASISANEGVNATLNVSLSAACPTRTVSVQYSTAAGTATSNSDFTSASNALLTFNPGQTSEVISIPTAADSLDEIDESFTVTLSSPTNGILGSPSSASVTIIDDDNAPTILLSASIASISESGPSVTLTATLSAISGKNISIPFSLSGTAVDNSDYTVTASPIVINAGSLSANISLTPIEDSIVDPSETVTVTLGAPTNGTLGATFAQTVTILDNDLGSFSISGVMGVGDAVVDSNLSNSVVPGLNWTASASATGYKISVVSDDLATIVCAEQTVGNVLTYQFLVGDCSLTLGSYYRLRVQATDGVNYQNASNNEYRFYVNSTPSLASNGEGPWYVLAGSSITINALGGASPTVGVVTDADGDTVAFSSIGLGTLGTVTGGASSFTYSVANDVALHGSDTISYSIQDSRGGVRSGSISIFVMQPYTWTGKTSALWSTTGNWCGSIAADKRSCIGAGSAPGASSTSLNLHFDSTCVSGSCSPTTDSNISVNSVRIKANGFTQGTGFTLTVGSGGWTQSGGAFVGSSGSTSSNNIYLGATLISAGSFQSTRSTLIVSGNWTLNNSVIWNHNNGLLRFATSGSTISMGGKQTYDLETAASLNFSSETIRVSNDLTIRGCYNCYLDSATFEVVRNLTIGTVDGYGLTGTGIVKVIGGLSGSTINGTGGSVPNLIVDTGTNPVTLMGTINIEGLPTPSYTYLSSGVFTATGSTIVTSANGFVSPTLFRPGNVIYNNLGINRADFDGGTVNVDGNLVIGGGYNAYINNGTVRVKGNITANAEGGYGNVGSALIKLIGNPSGSTITGAAGSAIPSLEIDTGSYNVTLNGQVSISGLWGPPSIYKVTSVGTLTTSGSTLTFLQAPSEFVPGLHFYNNVVFSHAPNRSLGGATMNIGGNLRLDGYNSISAGNLNVYGNVTATSTDPYGITGSVVVTLKGNAAGQTVTSASPYATIPNLVIDTGVNPVTFAATVAISDSIKVNSVGAFSTTGSTVYMRSSGYIDSLMDLGGRTLNNLTLDNSFVVTYGTMLQSPLTLSGTLTVNSMIFKINGSSLNTNAVVMNSNSSISKGGGTLIVNGSTISTTGSMYGGTVNP